MTVPGSDPRSVSALFAAALQGKDDEAWDAIAALHWRGSKEILDKACALAKSDDAAYRARAADILGQIGVPVRSFPEECFAALLPLLDDAADNVVYSAIFALHHVDQERAAPSVIPFAKHSDDSIRYATAFALGGVDTVEANETLLLLMTDEDADTRNWATFGIGQLSKADNDEISNALAARLADENADVRYEAIIGLGYRRDRRAIGFLKSMLHEEPDDLFARQAAARILGMETDGEMPTNELLGALQRLQRWGTK